MLFEPDNERSEEERRRLGLKGLKFCFFYYYFAKSGKGNTWNPMQVWVACRKEVFFFFYYFNAGWLRVVRRFILVSYLNI
jgi:hypothetical protein